MRVRTGDAGNGGGEEAGPVHGSQSHPLTIPGHQRRHQRQLTTPPYRHELPQAVPIVVYLSPRIRPLNRNPVGGWGSTLGGPHRSSLASRKGDGATSWP